MIFKNANFKGEFLAEAIAPKDVKPGDTIFVWDEFGEVQNVWVDETCVSIATFGHDMKCKVSPDSSIIRVIC